MRQASAAIVTESGAGGDGHSLAIVADRQLPVAALAALILEDSAYRLVHQARGVAAIRQSLEQFHPAVIIIDAKWSDTSSPVDIFGCGENVLILLDPEGDPAVFTQAAGARPRGYLARSAAREALQEAIDSLLRGGYYLDPVLTGQVLEALKQSGIPHPLPRPVLSTREREILVRVADGQSTKQIARECAITPKTVCSHVNNIYQKLKVRNRGQLVIYAMQQGFAAPRIQAS